MVEQVGGTLKIDYGSVEKAIEAVTKLVQQTDKLSTSINKIVGPAQKKSKAIDRITRSTEKSSTAMDTFNKSSQDLTKSVQVALGPLSGVAARITAMTSLFNRNSFAAAALIGTVTGLGVASKKLLGFAVQTEIELNRMEAVVVSLGERAAFTTGQLEGMAQVLAKDTLASVSEAREAVTTLATFDNIAPEVFETAIRSAYAFADVMGGQLSASIRQVGVLLEDPIRNVEMLRRRGIQFTRSEKEKIRALMETGRVMEAQTMTMKKFEIFLAQSEAKAKGLAGTFDRTTQLINNFFQAVAKQGNILGGVGTSFAKINDALENLLTKDTFIKGWGDVFATAANAVAWALRKLSDHIEAISAVAVPMLLFMSLTAVKGLLGFTATMIGLAKHAIILKNVIFGLGLMFSAAFGPAALTSAFAVNVLLGKVALAATVIGGLIIGYNLFIRKSAEASEETLAFGKEVDALKNQLLSIQDFTLRITFETNIDVLSDNIKGLQQRREELSRKMEGLKSLPEMGVPLRPAGRAEISRLEDQIKGLDESIEASKFVIGTWGDAVTEATHGATKGFTTVEYALNTLNNLENQWLPDIGKTKEQTRVLGQLGRILDDIREGNERGQAFIEGGRDAQSIVDLMAAIASGKDSSKKAKDSWQRLADTFVDLQFDIEQTTNKLLGIEDALAIDPKLLRQFEKLTSGDRQILASLNITPESTTEAQNILKERADLEKYMTKIAQDQLSEAQKMTEEMNKHLGMIDRITGRSEEELQILRDKVAAYAEFKAAEPLRKAGEELAEQQKLNGALRVGADAYRRMQGEIDILNKLKEHENAINKDQVTNWREVLVEMEHTLRATERVRQENEKLIEEHERYAQLAQDLGSVIANSFEDAIVSGNGLRDVLQGLLDDLLRIATRVMITKPLESAFIGMMTGGGYTSSPQLDSLTRENFVHRNAIGNVMTSSGPMPLKRYAAGGIARTPQLAMFGEGSMNEAYVPLPDGRTIPVTMRGGSNVQVNIVNNVGAEVKTNVTEGAHGTSIDVMIDRAVAEKLADQGSSSNRSLRTSFGAKNTLTGR